MASFRSAYFSLVAAAALLFGIGSFTAAMACPSTYPVAKAAEQSSSDQHDAAFDCVLANCSLVCQTLPSACKGLRVPDVHLHSYWVKVPVLEMANTGPEPPPPRTA
jgi:hypothetical protein